MKNIPRVSGLVAICFLAGLIASNAGLATASTTHRAPAAAKTIHIGWAGPLSGEQAYFGQSWLNGAKLAAKQFKFTGRLKGSKVSVSALDDVAVAADGVTDAHRFVAQHVDGVIADFNSSVTLASEPVYHRANIPQVTNSSNPAITGYHYHNLFRLIANDNEQGGIMATFAAKTLHLKNVASFNDSAAFGVGVSGTFSKSARGLGVKVTGPANLSATSNDYTGALTPVLAKHPNGIYFGGVATPGGLLCRQARQLGFTGPIMGPDGLFDPSYIKGCGPRIGSNAYVSFQAPPYNSSSKLKKFASTYKSTFHSAAGPYSLYGYNEMAFLLTAINTAGTTAHSAVNNAGHKITYHSIIGTQRVNANGQLVNAPIYIYRVVGTSFTLVMKG